MRHRIPIIALSCLVALTAFRAAGQAPNSTWVYRSASGNLLYQLDDHGQRIADFSQCGYRGGTEPLPHVNAVIPQNRWVYKSNSAFKVQLFHLAKINHLPGNFLAKIL